MSLLKSLCRSLSIIALWGIQWAIAGILIGALSSLLPNSNLESLLDPWIALAMPGFLGGLLFAISSRIRGISPNPGDSTIKTTLGRGVAVGVALGTLPFLFGTPNGQVPTATMFSAIYAITIALSVLAALGCNLAWRWAGKFPRTTSSA